MPRRKKQEHINSEERTAEPQLPESFVSTRRTKEKKETMERALTSIYGSEQANDLHTFERRPRAPFSWIWKTLVVCAALAGLAWLGFFFFNPKSSFSENDITLDVAAPAHIVAGTPVTYHLRYSNNLAIPLAALDIFVKYPDNFTFAKASVEPVDADHREWSLGALAPKTSGAIDIEGVIWGNAGDTAPFHAFLTYRPSNFNADFQKVGSADSTFAASALALSMEGPDHANIGDVHAYTVKIKNTGSSPTAAALVAVAYPQGFIAQKTAPAPTKDQNTWQVGALSPGQETDIVVTGSFVHGAELNAKTFSASELVQNNGQRYTQTAADFTTSLDAAAIELDLTANGSTASDTVSLGDKVVFAAHYKNNGNVPLNNVSARITLDTPSESNKSLFNWATIDDKQDGAIRGEQVSSTVRRGTIVWTKKEVPAFASLKPNDEGVIQFTLSLKDKNSIDVNKLISTQSAAYVELFSGDTQNTLLIQSNTVTLLLESNVALSALAQFKDKEQDAQGNAVAVYTVTWTLENTVHEISSVQIASSLSSHAIWMGGAHTNAGDVSFDAGSNQVQWKINRIPVSFPRTVISFDIGVPSVSNASTSTPLMEKTRLEATDSSTQNSILLEKNPITVQ